MNCYRIDAVASVLAFCLICTRVGSFVHAIQEESHPLSICGGGDAQVSTKGETGFHRVLLQSSSSKVVLGSNIASSPASHKQKAELLAVQHPLSSIHSFRNSSLDAHIKFPNYTNLSVSTKQPEDAAKEVPIAQKIVGEPELPKEQNQSVVPQHEEEIEKIKKSLHIAIAMMLLGFVAFVMALFYLVNFPDEDIQGATWRLLSTTMSIFLAVLMFSATQHLMSFMTGTSHDDEGESADEQHELRVAIGHGVVTRKIMLLSFARFISFWVGLQLYMYFFHGRSHTLKAIAKLGSHIVAFAGMDAFGTLQEEGVFAGSLLHSIVGVNILGIIIWVLFDLADFVRSHVVKNSPDPEARQEWLSECSSAEHETAAFILGLLLSQCIRFAITGSLPPLEGGSPMGKSRAQVHTLFAVALCLGMIVVPVEMTLKNLTTFAAACGSDHAWGKGWGTRLLRVMRETLSMTMAWCLTYWGRWAFWMSTGDSGLGYGDKMTALLATSLFMSVFCFALLLAIDFLADRVVGESGLAGLIALGNSMGLVLGLAWESTFHEAVGAIGEVHLFPIGYELNVLLLILAFVAVTLPAWMIYILPEAIRNRGEGCHWTEDNEY